MRYIVFDQRLPPEFLLTFVVLPRFPSTVRLYYYPTTSTLCRLRLTASEILHPRIFFLYPAFLSTGCSCVIHRVAYLSYPLLAAKERASFRWKLGKGVM